LEEQDSYEFLTDKEIEKAITAKPIDSRPPLSSQKIVSPITASKNRKSTFASSVSLFHCHFFLFIHPLHAFRSSNDDASRSMAGQDCFRLQPRDGNLESKAQSQEKEANDAEHKEPPSSSKAPKKAGAEKEIIHLTSSGGTPPESSCHVSLPTLSNCFQL
jgi:hypothetical protein